MAFKLVIASALLVQVAFGFSISQPNLLGASETFISGGISRPVYSSVSERIVSSGPSVTSISSSPSLITSAPAVSSFSSVTSPSFVSSINSSPVSSITTVSSPSYVNSITSPALISAGPTYSQFSEVITDVDVINAGYYGNVGLAGAGLGVNTVTVQQPSVAVSALPVFNVLSGSPVYEVPCGVVVASENQFGGNVAVQGTVPFYGSSWFEGAVPSQGEATLAFGAGQGASLLEAGCGLGLGGANGFSIEGVTSASPVTSAAAAAAAAAAASSAAINNAINNNNRHRLVY